MNYVTTISMCPTAASVTVSNIYIYRIMHLVHRVPQESCVTGSPDAYSHLRRKLKAVSSDPRQLDRAKSYCTLIRSSELWKHVLKRVKIKPEGGVLAVPADRFILFCSVPFFYTVVLFSHFIGVRIHLLHSSNQLKIKLSCKKILN
jgi:hypothetical protein